MKLGLYAQEIGVAGSDPISTAPYPLGASRAGVCQTGGKVRTEHHVTGTLAATGDLIVRGRNIRIDEQLVTAGGTLNVLVNSTTHQFVGPPVLCSDKVTLCSAGCATGETCDTPREMTDPLNDVSAVPSGYVDKTGTATDLLRCQDCRTVVDALSLHIEAMTIDENRGVLRIRPKQQGTPIVIPSIPLYVLAFDDFILGRKAEQQFIGDPATTLIVRVAGRFRLGGWGQVSLSGLRADHVLFSVEGSLAARRLSRVKISQHSVFRGTILAPSRMLIIGRFAEFHGSAVADRVRVRYHATTEHEPFVAPVP